VRSHRRVEPNGKDLVARNRDRLRDRRTGIDGDDLRILQDQIGGRGGGRDGYD
jgi:hypothetical protein